VGHPQKPSPPSTITFFGDDVAPLASACSLVVVAVAGEDDTGLGIMGILKDDTPAQQICKDTKRDRTFIFFPRFSSLLMDERRMIMVRARKEKEASLL
jgi:hypothetical protein